MARGLDARWVPGIGDPGLAGWITVVAYLLVALMCLANARHEAARSGAARFWGGLGLLLILLALNKQLDLQSWLTQTGKDLARAQGWYRHRQTVQLAFIAAIGGAALGFVGWMLWRVRAADDSGRRARDSAGGWVPDAPTRWAMAGLALLLAWVVIRAASFHHIDRRLGLSIGGLALNGWLELLCLAAIGVPALWHRRRSRLVAATESGGVESSR